MTFLNKFWLIFSLSLFVFSCTQKESEKAIDFSKSGVVFLEAQNYSSAMEQFQAALKIAATDTLKSTLYRNISTCFYYQDEIDSAVRYSKLAFEILPDSDVHFWLNQGEYFLLNDHIQKAIQSFEKGLKIDSNQPEILTNLAIIYSGNYGEKFMNLNQALDVAKKAVSRSNSTSNQELLGSIYLELDQYEKAKLIYQKLYTENPTVKMYQFKHGLSMYFLGDEDSGIEAMKEAADRDDACRLLFESIVNNE
jgi:tetratricopeptide (TPR) repeat protein